MPTVDESKSHLIHPDGTKIQVLMPDGIEWDAEATRLAYDAYDASLGS